MSLDLVNQKCEACTIDAPRVSKEESEILIQTLNNWEILNDEFGEVIIEKIVLR